jgi:SAM-dependent methyltransferase
MPEQEYDIINYDPSDAVVVPAEAVISTGRRFGVAPAGGFQDGLDLGCGTGKWLVSLRNALPGRIVGVDASQGACALARERAPTAEVICARLEAITADALGRFDIVFCAGVLYALPSDVRAHTLSLIRDCLRPGGLALMTYYAGPLHEARAPFGRWVQSQVPSGLSPADAIACARALIANNAPQVGDPMLATRLRDLLRLAASAHDVNVFHETLNPHFSALETSRLAEPPLWFLDDLLSPLPYAGHDPEGRRLMVALTEAAGGAYRRSVFAKA